MVVCKNSVTRLLHLLSLAVVAALLAACGTLAHKPVPENLADSAEVLGLVGIRHWGDEAPLDLEEQAAALMEKLRRNYSVTAETRGPITLDHLALSGGGEDGAFGAGPLVGWSERGTRPEFQAVTGISVGAIVAPFAFLGPRYDARLQELLRAVAQPSRSTPEILAVLFGVSLLDRNPLAPLIKRFITAQMMEEIAREHRKGRLLRIGTTNLDAGRPVIWDIGKLAASGHPQALQMLHKIILASSAIPGVFAPVLFKVDAEGRRFDELHVDGGVTAVVFLYPAQIELREIFATEPFKQRLFVIRNGKLDADYDDKVTGLFSISERAVDTLIRSQGKGDLYKMYVIAQRDGIDYNLAYIPSSFAKQSESLFDKEYMSNLFDLGYDMGRKGYPWFKGPPGIGDHEYGK